MLPDINSNPSLKISLTKTLTELGPPYDIYHLDVKDTSGKWPDKKILVADLRRMGGGFSLLKWELNWNENHPVISAYLEVSIMGHDLDQWVHYDWETGEKLEDFKPSGK